MSDAALEPKYLPTLLQYYEEELIGYAYFIELMNGHSDHGVRKKLQLLADVELHAAAMVAPLIDRYKLALRSRAVLTSLGIDHAKAHEDLTWDAFVSHMVQRYPLYMDDFHGLEALAPSADLPYLQALTAHETAAINFANREQRGEAGAEDELSQYLLSPVPNSVGVT